MIYKNVKRLADKHRITIKALEKICGLANGTIGKWRENNNPKVESLIAVANYFGVTVDELIGRKKKTGGKA